MKNAIVLILSLVFTGSTFGQDSLRCYEFGSSILTVNSFNTKYTYAQPRPSFEILNGLFFRYNKKHYAYRALISYSENKIDYEPNPNTADGISGSVNNKNFMIGFGAQRNLKKNKDWLYGFLDLCYRNTFSNGTTFGGITGGQTKYTSNANGLDSYLGLGFKIKIIKNINLSPELVYNISYVQVKTKNSLPSTNRTNSASNLNINSLLKCHLTVKF